MPSLHPAIAEPFRLLRFGPPFDPFSAAFFHLLIFSSLYVFFRLVPEFHEFTARPFLLSPDLSLAPRSTSCQTFLPAFLLYMISSCRRFGFRNTFSTAFMPNCFEEEDPVCSVFISLFSRISLFWDLSLFLPNLPRCYSATPI